MSREADLARRYRRLLAWYPVEHRQVYEDEMLGVLLAGARPHQRYPGLREGADLVLAAVSLRLGRATAGLVGNRWTQAAAVIGVLTSVLLLGKQVRPVADDVGWLLRDVGAIPLVQPATTGFRIALWAAVTVAVLCGWRVGAAIGAWAAVLAELIVLAIRGAGYATTAVAASWQLLLAAIAAIALTVAVREVRGTEVLGWRRVAVLGVAGVIVAISPMAVPFLAEVSRPVDPGDGFVVLAGIDQRRVALVAVLTYAAVAVAVMAAITGIAPPIRRRVLALLAPAATLLAVVQLGTDLPFSGAIYNPELVLAGPVHWALMVTAPLLVLVAGLVIVRRRELTAPS